MIREAFRQARPIVFAAIWALKIAALQGCGKGDDSASQWQDISSEGWLYRDTLVFDSLPAQWTPQTLALGVRHDASYRYSNLWLEVSYLSHGKSKADTFDVELCDAFGRWHGHGTGASLQFTDTLRLRQLPDRRSPLKLRHIMRLDTLRGIEQIGISYTR